MRAFANGQGEALVHLHNLSGGLLGGDNLACRVSIAPGANVQITSSGATRIYKRRLTRGPASQQFRIDIASGAVLEYVPDQIIPFAGSSFRQCTEVFLEENAGLFWWETLTAGRAGEHFAYDHLAFRSSIYARGRPIALEQFELKPSACDMISPLRLGSFPCSTTFFICKTGVAEATWRQLESQLTNVAEELPATAQWGVSMLVADGLIVRGLALHHSDLHHGLMVLWQNAKRSLYNRDAIPPRKVY